MTAERLAELDALCAAATAGPWTPSVDSDRGYVEDEYGRWWLPSFKETPFSAFGMNDGEAQAERDATFLCTARTAVPELVAEVRRLRAELGAKDCYWEIPYDQVRCPKHGGTIRECPLPKAN